MYAGTTADIYEIYGVPVPDDYTKQEKVLDKLLREYNDIYAKVSLQDYYIKSLSQSKEVLQKELASTQRGMEYQQKAIADIEEKASLMVYSSPDEIIKIVVDYSTSIRKYKTLTSKHSEIQASLIQAIPTPNEQLAAAASSKKKEVNVQKSILQNARKFSEVGDVKGIKPPTAYRPMYVTSPFGFRVDPKYGNISYHSGLDLRSPEGTEVYSLLKGKVEAVEYTKLGGNTIIIDHGDGVKTSYLHLQRPLVTVGQAVKQYELIALSGNTGEWTTGPHLHVSLYLNGNAVDPYLLWR